MFGGWNQGLINRFEPRLQTTSLLDFPTSSDKNQETIRLEILDLETSKVILFWQQIFQMYMTVLFSMCGVQLIFTLFFWLMQNAHFLKDAAHLSTKKLT